MPKRLLIGCALALTLSGCFTTYTDIPFDSSPRVLRGSWNATLRYDCQTRASSVPVWQRDGERVAARVGVSVFVWNATTGTATSFDTLEDVRPLGLRAAPNELIVLSNDTANNRQQWRWLEATTGQPSGDPVLLPPATYVRALSPDLERVATAAFSGEPTLAVWNARSGVKTLAVPFAGKDFIGAVSFDEEGAALAVVVNREIVVLEASGQRRFSVQTALSADGVQLTKQHLVTSTGSKLEWFDASSGAPVRTLELPSGARIEFPSDKTRFMVFLTDNETLEVYDLASGKLETTTTQGDVLGFSPDGTRALFAGSQESCGLGLRRLTSSETLRLPTDEPEAIPSVWAFTPSLQSERFYTISGSVEAAKLEGYTVAGLGTGADCFPGNGFDQRCERYVQTQARPPLQDTVALTLRKPDAPELIGYVIRGASFGNTADPDAEWAGWLNIGGRQYTFTLEPR
jgi:hypothetical protein